MEEPRAKQVRAWSLRFKVAGAAAAMATQAGGPLARMFGGILASFGALGIAADALAQDPAASDYYKRVIPSPWRLDEAVVGTVDAPSAFPTVMLGLNQGTAEIRAMVRAYERAQGAAMRRDTRYVGPRLQEAEEFSDQASQTLSVVGAATVELADGLPLSDDETTGDLTVPRAPSELSDAALAFLYSAGVPIEQLRRALRVASSAARKERPGRPSDQIRTAGLAMSDFALLLAEWSPESRLFGP